MPDLRALDHRFTIEPVTEARMKALQARSHPGAYENEPVPDHIRAQVKQVDETDRMVRLAGPHETLWMPKPVPRPNWFAMARGYCDHLLGKYACKDFVAIEQGDVVVDCGSFVGGFALGAARKASRVLAIEPTPISFDCLRRNVEGSIVEPFQLGLFDRPDTLTFYLHPNPTDNSMLAEPGQNSEPVTSDVITLDQLRDRAGVKVIDFLKVEAEGVELEILTHARPDTVRKIAIDAGPERFGASPLLDIAVMLAARGYKLANRNYWLYARV